MRKKGFDWKSPQNLISMVAISAAAIVTIANYINLPMVTKALAEEQKAQDKRVTAIERYVDINQAILENNQKQQQQIQQQLIQYPNQQQVQQPVEWYLAEDGYYYTKHGLYWWDEKSQTWYEVKND